MRISDWSSDVCSSDLSAATFKVIDGVRWSIPGDFARREEDGSVTVLCRGSVCINTGGEKVHPEEVEAVLLRHEDVFDAVVVGPDHEIGSATCRESVGQSVSIEAVDGPIKKNTK